MPTELLTNKNKLNIKLYISLRETMNWFSYISKIHLIALYRDLLLILSFLSNSFFIRKFAQVPFLRTVKIANARNGKYPVPYPSSIGKGLILSKLSQVPALFSSILERRNKFAHRSFRFLPYINIIIIKTRECVKVAANLRQK